MVLALEPVAYLPDVGGVRTEHVILIAETGAEVLSSFAPGFWAWVLSPITRATRHLERAGGCILP